MTYSTCNENYFIPIATNNSGRVCGWDGKETVADEQWYLSEVFITEISEEFGDDVLEGAEGDEDGHERDRKDEYTA